MTIRTRVLPTPRLTSVVRRSRLIQGRGRLLSREQLIDDVWGRGTAITDRVVDNHMMNLRRKLEDVPAEPRFLVSVRGLGYRFDNPDDSQTNC